MDMLEEQSREQKDPNIYIDEYVRLWKNHWKEMLEENIQDMGKAHAFRQEVYNKEKYQLSKIGVFGGGSTYERGQDCLNLCG